MADNTGEETQETIEDVDELAGEELFEVPADLEDEPAGAQTDEADADPATAEPPAEKPTAEQPRDEKGKFAPKDAPATDEGQPPEPAQAPESSAPSPTPDTAAEPEPELEFSFRADGQPIQIKGSKVTADGIFIPKQYMPDVQRLLSHGVTYQGSFKQRLTEAKQEVEQTKAQVHEEVERSKAFLNFFADLLDRQEAGEPAIETWLDDFRQNRVKLEADATLAAAKALRERQAAPVRLDGFDDDEAQGEPEEVDPEELEQLSQNLAPELGTRLSGMLQSEGIRGLAGSELTRIRDYMTAPQRIGQYFRVALEDIPEYGVQKGQIVALDDAIKEELKYQAGLILGARQAAAELKAAEQKNARGNGNPVPPTTTVNGQGVPKGKKPVPQFKNKQEMEEWFAAEDPLS